MPLFVLDRDSSELLNQNYRLPDVAAGPMPAARGAAAAPEHPEIFVHDEALAVLPLEDVGEGMAEPERVYTLRVDSGLKEPDFTYRGGANTWRAGSASAGGERLVMRDSRLMKVSQVVRVDRRMTDEVMNVMVDLARTAIKRAVSEAVWGSAPQSGSGALLSGLPDFLVPSQDLVFDANQTFSANFDRLLARCRPGGEGLGADADAIVCSETAFINYMADREGRGLTVECCYSPLTGRIQRHHRGKPLLVGRVPEPAGSGTTVAYAMSLVGRSRVRLAHRGGDPGELGTRVGMPTTVVGLDGAGEASSATVGVEVWGEFALLVPEPQSFARMTGVPNA